MEIYITIFSYLFYCFICFAFVYSGETVAVWSDEDSRPSCYFDLVKEEVSHLKELDEFSLRYYIEDKIGPKYHYYLLAREIEEYQYDCEYGFEYFVLPLFFSIIIAFLFIEMELFESWLVCFLIAVAINILTFIVIGLLYEKCTYFKIMRFWGADYSDQHYEYLKSIKDTVIFRRSIRKILRAATVVVYLLFFFEFPE